MKWLAMRSGLENQKASNQRPVPYSHTPSRTIASTSRLSIRLDARAPLLGLPGLDVVLDVGRARRQRGV